MNKELPAQSGLAKGWVLSIIGIVVLIAIIFVVMHSAPSSPSTSQPTTTTPQATSTTPTKSTTTPTGANSSVEFSTPQQVTIEGYSGPEEDADVSPDGKYLFFDSHDDSGSPEYLYMASRIDYKTFQFIGRVPGIDIQAIEGVEDLAGNFYFVSPLLRAQGGATSIGHGTFVGGTVTNAGPLSGITPKPAPAGDQGITFDLYITPDGNTLFFSDFVVDSQFKVQSAQLSIATKNADGSFTRLANSDDILKNVNGMGSLVYNAAPSPDGLTLLFNAAPYFGPTPQIYIATRTSTSVPFGTPELVTAANASGGFPETGSFSYDGQYFYYHRVTGQTSSQIWVLRRSR
jgi:hypothetical protein